MLVVYVHLVEGEKVPGITGMTLILDEFVEGGREWRLENGGDWILLCSSIDKPYVFQIFQN